VLATGVAGTPPLKRKMIRHHPGRALSFNGRISSGVAASRPDLAHLALLALTIGMRRLPPGRSMMPTIRDEKNHHQDDDFRPRVARSPLWGRARPVGSRAPWAGCHDVHEDHQGGTLADARSGISSLIHITPSKTGD